VADVDKRAVVMNDLAYHHLMPCTNKAFFYVQAAQDPEENEDVRKAW